MTQSKTTAEANLELIQSVIPAEEKIYTWCYRIDGTFVASYCPKQMVHTFEQAFRALGGLRKAIEAISRPDPRIPMIIGSAVGIQWAVTLETERHNDLIFVIGPVRYSHPDEKQFSTDLHAAAPGYANLSWISFLCAHTDELPVVSYAVFTRYVIMIHNVLTGSQAGLDALYDLSGQDGEIKEKQAGERNRMQIWMNEQAMLKMVREGNINYHEALKESAGLSGGVQMHGRDPLRQMKTSIIVFVTLVSRAAMEGGLSPET
ncbi:MAG: hypothetical protein IKG55_10175, partial [Solobacterium sp.]|nr:hypothetical protein [Solobacterium sp.]